MSVWVYVGNILITGTSNILIHKLIDFLHATFSLQKLGRHEYLLGTRVKNLSTGCMLLTHSKFIPDLLIHTKMFNVNGVTTPILSTCKLRKHGTSTHSDPHKYVSMVRALKYVTFTIPNVTFSVNKSNQLTNSPLVSH